METNTRVRLPYCQILIGSCVALILSGCGGGGGGSGSSASGGSGGSGNPQSYTVSGTVSGLSAGGLVRAATAPRCSSARESTPAPE
jgi:hypothetical protein